jgi:hypothetical protein
VVNVKLLMRQRESLTGRSGSLIIKSNKEGVCRNFFSKKYFLLPIFTYFRVLAEIVDRLMSPDYDKVAEKAHGRAFN